LIVNIRQNREQIFSDTCNFNFRKGMIIFFWDTGGVMNRNTGAVIDQRTINALMAGAGN
jgi:hypothetical protein